jgi:carbonic anhydrase
MPTRRGFIAAMPVAAAAAASSRAFAASNDECAVFTPERQRATTPGDALRLLQEGNARFVAGKTINCDMVAQLHAASKGQAPFAAMVGCIDSRVPPEMVFDQRIGDIFCARIAGNFVDTDIIGSLEFATKLAGAKLIVVLGHNECGAIKGAVDGARLGNLTAMLRNFDAALAATHTVPAPGNSKNAALVQAVAEANVKIATKRLTENSDVLRGLVASKELMVVGAMNDIATGRVTLFAPA